MSGVALNFDSGTYGQAAGHDLFVTFEEEAEYLPGASATAGTPMFANVEFIRIRFPGDSSKEVFEKVNDQHRHTYARQYEAFKRANGGEVELDGIPLKQWPQMTKALVATFHAINIYTIQHLASVSDAHIHRLGVGGDKWRARARAHLLALEDTAATDRTASRNADLEEQLRLMSGQIQQLTGALNLQNAQLEQLKAAGNQGIGITHIQNLAGSSQAPTEPRSALDDEPAPAKRGRPTNAEREARAAAAAA